MLGDRGMRGRGRGARVRGMRGRGKGAKGTGIRVRGRSIRVRVRVGAMEGVGVVGINKKGHLR